MIRVLFVEIKPLTSKTFCCIILKRCFGTHITDLTYYSTSKLKVYENTLRKNKFDYNLLSITRISRDMEKCIYYHGFNEHGDDY